MNKYDKLNKTNKTNKTNKKMSRTKNKTLKNKRKIHHVTSITQVYNDIYSKKQNQDRLACFLINNNKMKYFTFTVFFFMLTYWRENLKKYLNFDKWHLLFKKSLLEDIDEKNKIINKIGFNETEFNNIIRYVNNKNKGELFHYLDNKYLKVTAAINILAEPHYTIYHVIFNKKLQNTFITQLKKLLMIQNIEWNDIYHIYTKLPNKKEKLTYNFFIYDLLYDSDESIVNGSIYRMNLNNMSFFREKINNYNNSKNKKDFHYINECNKSILNLDDDFDRYFDYGIYDSRDIYKIDVYTPYAKIMNKYKRKFIGGPSGSTAVLYISLFHLYGFSFTRRNKIMLFGMLISDYIPLWHSIVEIIFSAYPEFKDKKIPKYYLEHNATQYAIKLLKNYIS